MPEKSEKKQKKRTESVKDKRSESTELSRFFYFLNGKIERAEDMHHKTDLVYQNEQSIIIIYRAVLSALLGEYGFKLPDTDNNSIRVMSKRSFQSYLKWLKDPAGEKNEKEIRKTCDVYLYYFIIYAIYAAFCSMIDDNLTEYSLEEEIRNVFPADSFKTYFKGSFINEGDTYFYLKDERAEGLTDKITAVYVACILRLFWREMADYYEDAPGMEDDRDLKWLSIFLKDGSLSDAHHYLKSCSERSALAFEEDIGRFNRPSDVYKAYDGQIYQGFRYYFTGFNSAKTIYESVKQKDHFIYLNFMNPRFFYNGSIENLIYVNYGFYLGDLYDSSLDIVLVLCECQQIRNDQTDAFFDDIGQILELYKGITLVIGSRYKKNTLKYIDDINHIALKISESDIGKYLEDKGVSMELIPDMAKLLAGCPELIQFTRNQKSDHFGILDSFYGKNRDRIVMKITGLILNEIDRFERKKESFFEIEDAYEDECIRGILYRDFDDYTDPRKFYAILSRKGLITDGQWSLLPLLRGYVFALGIDLLREKGEGDRIRTHIRQLKESLKRLSLVGQDEDCAPEKAIMLLQYLKSKGIDYKEFGDEARNDLVMILFLCENYYDDLRQISFLFGLSDEFEKYYSFLPKDAEGLKVRSGYGYYLLHIDQYLKEKGNERKEREVELSDRSERIQKECLKDLDDNRDLDPDDLLKAFILSNLGAVELFRSVISEENKEAHIRNALAFHEKACGYREQSSGKGDMEFDLRYARSLGNIGTCYFHLKEYDEAAGYQLKALKIRERYGDRSLDIAESLVRYSGAYYRTDGFEPETVIANLEKACDLDKKYGLVNECKGLHRNFIGFLNHFDWKDLDADQIDRMTLLAKRIDALFSALINEKGSCASLLLDKKMKESGVI